MKAIDFWNFLCNKHNYRFFTGVPCNGLLALYKTMPVSDLHYIPAANENIGLGLVCGTSIAGFKSSILLSADKLDKTIINNVGVPFIILAAGKKSSDTNLNSMSLLNSNINKIDLFINDVEKSKAPGIIFIKDGIIL